MMGSHSTVEAIVDNDPTRRKTGDNSFTSFRIWKKQSGGVMRINVTAFDDLGDYVYDTIREGDIVLVTGELQVSEYVDKNGVNRSSLGMKAESVGISVITLGKEKSPVEKKKKDVSPESKNHPKKKKHKDDYTDLDTRAVWMRNRGYSEKDVNDYHNLAPEGYWEEVGHWVTEDDFEDINDIYDSLENRWEWHPDDREEWW